MKKLSLLFSIITFSLLVYSQKDKTTADAYKYIKSNNVLVETLQDYGFKVKSMSDIKITQESSEKGKFYKYQTKSFKKIVNSRTEYASIRSLKNKGSINFYCTFKSDGIDYKAPFSIDWDRSSYEYNYSRNRDDIIIHNEWIKPRYYFRPTNITSKNQPKTTESYRISSCLDYLESLKDKPIAHDAMVNNKLYNIVKIVEVQCPEDQVMILAATKHSWQLCLLAEVHRSKALDSDFESVRLEKINMSFHSEFKGGKWIISKLNYSPKTVSWKSKKDFSSHIVEWKEGTKVGTLMTSSIKDITNKYAKPSELSYGNKNAKNRHESFINLIKEFDQGKQISDDEIKFFFTDINYGKKFFESINKYSDTTYNIEITKMIYKFGRMYESVLFNDKTNAYEIEIFTGINKVETKVVEKRTKTKGFKAYVKPYTITKELKYSKTQTTIGIKWVYVNDTFMIVDDCTLN